jgi:ribosome maturation factor RimP
VDANSRIAALAGPAAQSAGLVLDGVEVSPAGNRTKVVITVDLPEDAVGSATLDQIADASRAINAALDAEDPLNTAYVLEIGTPGLDRPLTERRHFLRARTRLVSLALRDGGSVEGRLMDVAGDTVVLDVNGESREMPLADVATGRIEIEWKKLDELSEDTEGQD